MKNVLLWGLLAVFMVWSAGISAQDFPTPDTDQSKCYDATQEIPCPSTEEPFYGQDADYTINPMSFIKLDANGKELPESATEWAMVKDNVTGLIWEIKHDKDDVQDYANPNDADNTYSWYDPDSETNGGDAGTDGEGTDTYDFIIALNAANYGGHSDWRMPTSSELLSILAFTDPNDIYVKYFKPAGEYWSSCSVADTPKQARSLTNYDIGRTYKVGKIRVRAVRSGQLNVENRFVIHGDETVTDKNTGLMWESKTDDNGERDKDNIYTWQEALAYCENLNLAGHSDWRLPTIKELYSLVDVTKYNPAIDTGYFPNTAQLVTWTTYSYYWSSTTDYSRYFWGMCIDFDNGFIENLNKIDGFIPGGFVRAVRGGQLGAYDDLVILTRDIPYTAYVKQSYIRNFSVDIDEGQSVLVEITPVTNTDQYIVDGQFGEKIKCIRCGEYSTDQQNADDRYEIVISPSDAGTYYFTVYGRKIAETESGFSIVVRYVDKHFSNVSPKNAGNSGEVSLHLTGLGFVEYMNLQLTHPAYPTIDAEEAIIADRTDSVRESIPRTRPSRAFAGRHPKPVCSRR